MGIWRTGTVGRWQPTGKGGRAVFHVDIDGVAEMAAVMDDTGNQAIVQESDEGDGAIVVAWRVQTD